MKFNNNYITRITDIFISVTFLFIVSILLILIAGIIKVDSKGPVFFRQKRLGKKGTLFGVLKFRTMCIDSEERLANDPNLYQKYVDNNFKLEPYEDPRITKVGSFLRKTSLDEIPQFVNVLKGEMSIVGPRPITKEELAFYGKKASKLLSVKPGITGFWQVMGRSNIGYPKRARLELFYVERKNLLFDLKIIAKTIPAVFKKEGAY